MTIEWVEAQAHFKLFPGININMDWYFHPNQADKYQVPHTDDNLNVANLAPVLSNHV
jgi:hypothetical protein